MTEHPLTDDAILGGRLKLFQPAKGHRAGSDSVLVAAMIDAREGEDIADFGAGVGAAGLAVLTRLPYVRMHLVEIDPGLAALAGRNAERNGLSERTRLCVGDVCTLGRPGSDFPDLVVDHVLANPPFHDARGRRSPDHGKALAHMAGPGLIEDWSRAAARILRTGGTFSIIHRPDALSPLLAALDGRFGNVALRFVHATADALAVRVLAQGTKGSRAPLRILPPLVLNGEDGTFSEQAEAIHRNMQPIIMA
ncbi:tRNA1(Val) (adenine(37)-N6)-methyltransferase [Terrihabitans sp. B22-R8]|uniref:tRNA1(Val) (adenine(37)-N6)-methyltransferase n=1 Tax=Terrihabitans sp. B22-R8 TaxID=3425128 RepID=UPI00403CEF76